MASTQRTLGSPCSGADLQPPSPADVTPGAVCQPLRETHVNDAVEAIQQNPEFKKIALKNRTTGYWAKRRDRVNFIHTKLPGLISALQVAECCPSQNFKIGRILQAFAEDCRTLLPDLGKFLPIYDDGELPFFLAVRALTDAEFEACLRTVREAEERRQSSLQHLQSPAAGPEPKRLPASDVSTNYSRPLAPQPVVDHPDRNSGDSGYLSEGKSSEHPRGSNVNPGVGASVQNNAQQHDGSQPGGQVGPREEQDGGLSTSIGRGEESYHCHMCSKKWQANPRGYGFWRHHMLTEHDARVYWKCEHPPCGGHGKYTEQDSYETHHHGQKHRLCVDDTRNGKQAACPYPPTITCPTPGRIVTVCLDCDELVGFVVENSWQNLVHHWGNNHKARIKARTLDIGRANFGYKLDRLLYFRPDGLWSNTIAHFQAFNNPELALSFDHNDEKVMALFLDLQLPIRGQTEAEIEARRNELAQSYLDLGTAYLRDPLFLPQVIDHQGGLLPSAGITSHPEEMRPQALEHPPRSDSLGPPHSGAAIAITPAPAAAVYNYNYNYSAGIPAPHYGPPQTQHSNRMSVCYDLDSSGTNPPVQGNSSVGNSGSPTYHHSPY